jgi:hypothetical protein
VENVDDTKNFRQIVLEQQKQIREDWKKMAKIYPDCFDANGRPIVEALPPLPEYRRWRDGNGLN